MNFSTLKDFLLHRMSMSHIYQPVLIRALIDSGGSATVRQLAHEFLRQDESQVIYYERRIRDMPAKVLKKHGVITQSANLISLTVPRLTLEQKAELRKICDQKLQDYIVRNGISIWDYRLIDNQGINDDLRFRVLKEAKGRCALCGASNKARCILTTSSLATKAVRPFMRTCKPCVRNVTAPNATRTELISEVTVRRLSP